MTERVSNNSRRRFIKLGVAGLAAAPLANLLVNGAARSEDLPQLEEDNPQAQALKYSHDASTATAEGQNCANCQLFTAEAGAEWGPCTIFPGKHVNANGWCSAWVKKAG